VAAGRPVTRPDASGGVRTTAAVAAALTTAALPVFLLGSSSDAVRADLGISETAIGGAITAMFVAVGVSANLVGRLTERIGATSALRLGVVGSVTATFAIGATATSWWHLLVPLLVAGVALGMIDTGGARAFADRVRAGRQGTAFGVKEASIPSASLLAGLALPTLAASFGWRASFLAAPALGVLVLVALPRRWPTAPASAVDGATDASVGDTTDAPVGETTDAPVGGATGVGTTGDAEAGPRSMLRFAVAVGLGAGAATAGATFLVPGTTVRGLSPAAAGALLVAASLASIVARIGLGRWADGPTAQPARAVTVCLAIGGSGAALLAAPTPTVLAAAGAVILLGAGWGWTGLAFLAAVRARPDAPAVAAGEVLTGLGVGGALGPLAFGSLAANLSYGAAWSATAVALLAAGGLATTSLPRRPRSGHDRSRTR
jgi:predicted MFS family arabinose efflux permease